MNIHTFIFNPYQVNTYIVWDDTKNCLIIDAGNYSDYENQKIVEFIDKNQLIPIGIVLTHAHIDHILGCRFLKDHFKINLITHPKAKSFIDNARAYGQMLGLEIEEAFQPDKFIEENQSINFGNTNFKVFYTPGHVDGSICLYNKDNNVIFTGDVLFAGSIGRTDLPTGNFENLISNIKNKILTLPSETIVYPGHGETTTIKEEIENNPFLS